MRCTVTAAEWRADYQTVASADDTAGPATTLTSWIVKDGRPGASRA